LQGEDLKVGVIATLKHFAGYSLSEGGRNRAPAHIPTREFREVFLFPFEAAVRCAGAWSVMNAYNEIDGIPCAASRDLLTGILRGEWGFKGYVVSDYMSIRMLQSLHHIASDKKEAAMYALKAGIDIELPKAECYDKPLSQAFNEGLVSESLINESVSRILKAKFLLGLFENPYVDIDAVPKFLCTEEQRTLALRTARESIVLLKNDGVLPLARNLKSIAVVGPNADSTRNLLGDYSYAALLLSQNATTSGTSILAAIKKEALPQSIVHYAKGCDVTGFSNTEFEGALKAAAESDVTVVAVGERAGTSPLDVSGEFKDRTSLRLPGVQEDLIKELFKTGKPIVIILINGRPISLDKISKKSSAIIEAWFPGEMGGIAVADVLYGNYNPGGRLPISFPINVGQIPVHYNRKPSSFENYVFTNSKPEYPFGHGLSYTKFKYSSLKITPQKVAPAGKVNISLDIANIGNHVGDEVVQLYIQDEVASLSRPVKELKGFKRVTLTKNERKTITFSLSMDQLAFYDLWKRLVVEPGKFNVMIGGSSEDIQLTGSFEVIGDKRIVTDYRTWFTQTIVE
jgi:beta-glucosidase